MRYITEYITIQHNIREVKLSYTPAYSAEMGRYALLEDTFKLYKADMSQYLSIYGEIIKECDEYFLKFSNVDLDEGQFVVVVTYAIENQSQCLLSEINTASLLSSTIIDSPYSPPALQQGYVLQRAEYLATQYKKSPRLKAIILSSLQQLEECFLEGDKIPFTFDLECVEGLYLEWIGKIVGVNRQYCGNFSDTLAYSLNVYRDAINNIVDIELDDECLRKLIKVKIQKNTKKIVNYKTLKEIVSIFLDREVLLEDYGNFEIGVDVGEIDDKLAKCLILLRAFMPLPLTIKLNYIESMLGNREDTLIVAAEGLCEAEGVLKAPNIVLQSTQQILSATSLEQIAIGTITEE